MMCVSTDVAGIGPTMNECTVSSVAAFTASSELPSAAAAADSSANSSATASCVSSLLSQLSPFAASSVSTVPAPMPSTLPVSLDQLVAALSSMESIAMIAEQLVPLLANLDPRLLMQMLQNLTNPSVATALSTYTAAVQFPVQNAADTGPQASASVVTTSSGNESVAAVQSADVVDSGRTVSAASSQSSIYTSEASEPDNDSTSVQTDTAQSLSLIHI